jgi:hypothetical protein
MHSQWLELTRIAVPLLPSLKSGVTALVLTVPEPSPAELMAALAGASGAVQITRTAIRYYRSRRGDNSKCG